MRKGRDFELLYHQLYSTLDRSLYTILSPAFIPDQITGQKREIDVLIEYYDPDHHVRRISIECRDRHSIQDVQWIEQLVTKKNDLNIDITIAATTTSFTEPAIKKAEKYGIVLEEAEKIDCLFIDKMTRNKFATLTFIYSKVIGLSFKGKNQKAFNSKELAANYTIDTIRSIERILTEEFYWPLDMRSTISSIEKKQNCHFCDAKPSTFSIIANIEKSESVELICDGVAITDIVINCVIQPVKYTIPIISGLITTDPHDSTVKNLLCEYYSDEASSRFSKIEDDFWYSLVLKAKNPYLRFLEILDVAVMPFETKNGSAFAFNMNSIDSYLGKLDFTELW